MTGLEAAAGYVASTSVVINLVLFMAILLACTFPYHRRRYDTTGQAFSLLSGAVVAYLVIVGTFTAGGQNFWPLVTYIWRGILA